MSVAARLRSCHSTFSIGRLRGRSFVREPGDSKGALRTGPRLLQSEALLLFKLLYRACSQNKLIFEKQPTFFLPNQRAMPGVF
jgi:hypothetical protein